MNGRVVALLLAATLLMPGAIAAQSHGSASGVVTTKAAPTRPVRVTFDQRVCGNQLPDEAVLVGPAGGLANVVVTLKGVKAPSPAREVRVRNERCAFVPRVQVVGTGGTLKTSSTDAVLHTTVVQQANGRQLFNVALPVPGMELSKPLPGAGVLRVGCNTHPWMRGWVIVSDEMAAVTGIDGRFAFANVPPGTYEMTFWHESLTIATQPVTIVAGKTATVAVEAK
ncbi:MAG: hypothetical protein IT178_04530 [Acidobacteria bacterium]|nr:hypothetical protein [Acidobacteriota bacterium]